MSTSQNGEMQPPKVMKKVDLVEDPLTNAQRELMYKHSKEQFEIYRKANRVRTFAFATGLFSFVGLIYGYTIFKMSGVDIAQEIENEVQQEANKL